MTRSTLLVVACFILFNAIAQNTLELTFTAIDSAAYIQLDSIKIMNRTYGGDTTLHWPDTVLVLYHVGIHENIVANSGFQIHQNYPNPVIEQTTISIYMPKMDEVILTITDVLGRTILIKDKLLDQGYNEFTFRPGIEEIYFFTARLKGTNRSIKILNAAQGKNRHCFLEYKGKIDRNSDFKDTRDLLDFPFTIGNELVCIAYADTLQSGISTAPEASETYTLQFGTNISCPGMPTVEYGGQTYNTIQIFNQCWLKENLNIGAMIMGTQQMTNNNTLEKYCYNNKVDSCTKYGGLYQWDEMMQYTTQQSAQGICPPGWHLPSDEELKVLEGAVDSHYGIGNQIWDDQSFRGFDAGANLKSTSGWFYEGNGTDLYGFSASPGGSRLRNGNFGAVGTLSKWWSSTDLGPSNFAWFHYLNSDDHRMGRDYFLDHDYGGSVRCLRNY